MISQRGRLVISSVVMGIATLAVLLATEPRLAMVWDEGYTLGREARLRNWFRALRDPAAFAATWQPPAVELVQHVGAPPPRRDQIDSRTKLLFDPAVLAYFWPFAREEPHGHPPFYALLGLLGDLIAPDLARSASSPAGADAPLRARPRRSSGNSSPAGGDTGRPLAGSTAWLFQPNLFAHAHYATYDAVLTSLWVLAIVAFGRALLVPPDGKRDWPGRLAILGFAFAIGRGDGDQAHRLVPSRGPRHLDGVVPRSPGGTDSPLQCCHLRVSFCSS